ncbi:MAG TPA: polymer-forming cytoskeletal protein [Thermoanaerobaculia bacterium]|nr:polymer-forming cytoskeletal protein [Thermoanaerobaculia bacterium]
MALFSKEAPPPPQARPNTSAGGAPSGTFFGPNISFDGTITGNESVTIEGSVHGKIDLQANLLVGTKARIDATVHAKNVTIEGKVVGDVSADERVELVASATVEGNIKAPKVIVADGARFRGSVDMGSAKPREDAAFNAAKVK